MQQCRLKCENGPIASDELGEQICQFRERGFVVIQDVFERDTVDAYLNGVLDSLAVSGDGRLAPPSDSILTIWPATAPRIHQMLIPALSHSTSIRRLPVLYETTWHIATEGASEYRNENWHCDIDPEGMPGNEYHFPREVHVGIYFTDMTLAHGPTEVVPGSHCHPPTKKQLDEGPRASFMCNKQDVVLWDQRLWHRATRRTVPGTRVFVTYGFCAAPANRQRPRPMPGAQADLWARSQDSQEQIFFGGPFLPIG